jgi:hypothetical protein
LGAKTNLSGEIDPDVNTRVFIGDSAGSPYKYLWNRTPTKPLTLFLTDGTEKANITTTLNIQPDGKCSFHVDAIDLPAFYGDGTGIFVGGAIEVTSTNPTTYEWTFTQPGTIDPKGDVYLPMYFSLQEVENKKVKANFQTLGSIISVKVTNRTVNDYLVAKLMRLYGDAFTTTGIVGFSTIARNAEPTWIGTTPGWTRTGGTGAADKGLGNLTGFTITKNNVDFVLPSITKSVTGAVDSFYVWVKNRTPSAGDTITIAVEN